MKRIITFLALLLTVAGFAQAFPKFTYQSVVRNAANDLVTNTTVGMRISILQGSVDGTAVFSEVHQPTTNANGLATLVIGDGIADVGSTSVIDWKNGPYFIKTQIDPLNGTNYTIEGTSQLLSVPYAMYAAKSQTTESVSLPYQILAATNMTSTVRGTNVYSAESVTIDKTGFYMIMLNCRGADNEKTYSFDADQSHDDEGYVFLYNTTTNSLATNSVPFIQRIVDFSSTTESVQYFLSSNVSDSSVIYLPAGSVIKLGAIVYATGSPTEPWFLNNISATFVKLQ